MEKVVIVAKTHTYENMWCVGGLALSSNRSLRLYTRLGAQQPHDTPLEVGQIWEMTWKREYSIQPPHVEDVRVLEQSYVGIQTALRETLQHRVQTWLGSPANLYDRHIVLNGTSAYICRSAGLPGRSTGFWLPGQPLTLRSISGKSYYSLEYKLSSNHAPLTLRIPYVGGEEPLGEIPAQALIRVSLARWWKKYEEEEKKCYLQLSGWYI